MGMEIIGVEYKDFQDRVLTFSLFNAGDPMRVQIDVRMDFSLTLNPLPVGPVVVKSGSTYTLSSGAWEDYGFYPGVEMTGNFGSITFTGEVIAAVNGAEMQVTDFIPDGDGEIDNGTVVLDITPEAFEFYINLVPHLQPGNEFSLIDGEVQRFTVTGVDTLAVLDNLPMAQQGYKSGGSNMFPTITRLADDGDKKVYRIFTQFKGWILIDSAPFTSNNCVKPWFRIAAWPQYQNPAVKTEIVYTVSDAESGFYNEVFNGGGPQYAITAVDWEVSGDPVNTFDHTQPTDFTIELVGLTDVYGTHGFSATSKFNLQLFRVPQQIGEYKNVPNAVENNLLMVVNDTPLVVGSNPDIIGSLYSDGSGVNIVDVTISQAGTTATITGTIVPNALYSALIQSKDSDDRVFRFAVRCEDYTLTDNNIRPAWLTVAFENSVKYTPPLGEWSEGFGYTTFNHKNEGIPYVPVEGEITAQRLITEDDILVDLQFRLPNYDEQLTNGRIFTGITLSIVGRKDNGEVFKLEETEVSFDPYPPFNGSPVIPDQSVPINFSLDRSFKLPPTSDKNEITVVRYPAIDVAGEFGVRVKYGVLLDWRYWLPQPGVSNDFYDISALFNGQTKDWEKYQTAEWRVALMFELNTTDGSYFNFVDLTHETYDQWPFDASISYFTLDGTPLTKPLADEATVVRADFTLDEPMNWLSGVWGHITVEPREGGPRWMSSTVLPGGNVTANPLQPLNGEVGCKLTLTGVGNKTARLETVIEPGNTVWQNGVSFTARIEGPYRDGEETEVTWNRVKQDTDFAQKPFMFTGEDRGFESCCDPQMKLADEVDLIGWKNDWTGAWERGDTVTFVLTKNGELTGFQPTALPFPETPNAYYCSFNWHDVLLTDGPGCYVLTTEVEYAGLTGSKVWGNFRLWPYSYLDLNGERVRSEISEGTVAITSEFNDNNVKEGINFTGARVTDTVRLKGKFGFFQPNTEIDNIQYTDRSMVKVRREDDMDYELRTAILTRCTVYPLLRHLNYENSCWVSDYNADNFDDYKEVSLIVKEGADIEHLEGSNTVKIKAKFEPKVKLSITNYDDDNPTASASAPPAVVSNIAGIVNSNNSFEVFFTPPGPYPLEDIQVEVYVNDVLDQSFTTPSMVDITLNIS